MATPRITHGQQERSVLTDLETSFPNFMRRALLWDEVPAGQDPPDFISPNPDAKIGLELTEWLDGDQMRPAKARESQRKEIHRVLTHNWEQEYQPKNFRGAFPSLIGSERISRTDELPLRQEFYACAAEVDHTWADNIDHRGNSHDRTEFASYPLLKKYFSAIHYIGGERHGSNWVDAEGDGGTFDLNGPAETLEQSLDSKLSDYSTPGRQAHLKAHDLSELNLLVHGDSKIYQYNTPARHLNLEEIARRGADYYTVHVQRHVFNRVWFFHSLDTADELNQSLGSGPGEGRVRWLAQLWPEFRVFPGSLSASRGTQRRLSA
jgi:hypothetical protein